MCCGLVTRPGVRGRAAVPGGSVNHTLKWTSNSVKTSLSVAPAPELAAAPTEGVVGIFVSKEPTARRSTILGGGAAAAAADADGVCAWACPVAAPAAATNEGTGSKAERLGVAACSSWGRPDWVGVEGTEAGASCANVDAVD
jgi:hypothetical protein